jgi:hypothetical protein
MNKHFGFLVGFGLADAMGIFHQVILIPIAEINSKEDVELVCREIFVTTAKGKRWQDIGLINWQRLPGEDVAHGSTK